MLSPKSILDEIKAIEILKNKKISLLGSGITILFVTAAIITYFKILLPSKQNLDKIPGLIQKVDSLQYLIVENNQVIIIDTISGIKEMKNDISGIKNKVRLIYIKMDIVKELFPLLEQRFNDIDRAINDQDDKRRGVYYPETEINVKKIKNETRL